MVKEIPPVSPMTQSLLEGGGLHSARDQDASSNDAKGAQSAVGGRIWDRLLAHIPPAQRLQALQASDNGDYPESSCSRLLQQSAPAADPFSNRVLLQQCLCQT